VQGWFSDTLPAFNEKLNGPIAFLHIDSDLYSSANCALNVFELRIVPGTILLFDELYNYPNAENHEWKALQEFLVRTGLKAEYLAFNTNHEQVALRIGK
jgi:hypothetical protein